MQLLDHLIRGIPMDNNQTLKKQKIEQIEKEWNIKFPDQYKLYLKTSDGGRPDKTYCSFNNINFLLDNLLAICAKKEYDFYRINRIVYANRIPHNTCIIADDQCGNLIIISLNQTDYGKIYFWDHNWEANEGEKPTYSNMKLIANSFDEFINNLKDESELDD
jgi:hypothetical protein